jgi:hypothetical protein
MARSEIFDDLFKSITPEMEEKWKQDRVNYKKSLSTEYQLGYYVGLEIVHRYLPTLSTDMIQSRNVIEVSQIDSEENKRLEEEWFSTTKYGGEGDGKSENGNKEKWDELYDHNKMLELKYLPHTLTCYMDVLNINDMKQFKEGIRTSLWDCDMCSYNIDIDNIKIYDDEDVRFTIMEFTLGVLIDNKTDEEI